MENNFNSKEMNASSQFCPNSACIASGLVGAGNIAIHCHKRRRYRCRKCGRTFSERQGTAFYRLHTPEDLVTAVISLLAHGCPLQAVVAAFGLDERTVAAWQQRAGVHCEKVHQQLIAQGQLDLQHVQADEIRAKARGMVIWLAMAIAVGSRLWLGGVSSTKRDRATIDSLLQLVARCALPLQPLLVCVDGLAAYPKSIKRAFRLKLARQPGQRGRSRLALWPELVIGVVIKRTERKGKWHRLVAVERRIAHGTMALAARLVAKAGGGEQINTSHIERFNATMRERLACLNRRCRRAVHKVQSLHYGMYLVGTVYNFCQAHHELRQRLLSGDNQRKWLERSPAMAAGISDHIWSMEELLKYKVAPTRQQPVKKRGRPPKAVITQSEPKRRGNPHKEMQV